MGLSGQDVLLGCVVIVPAIGLAVALAMFQAIEPHGARPDYLSATGCAIPLLAVGLLLSVIRPARRVGFTFALAAGVLWCVHYVVLNAFWR